MKKEFQFVDKRFELEIGTDSEAEGDFHKVPGTVLHGGQAHKGIFKLTKVAWETVNRKAQESARPLEEKLTEGCVDVLRAELYIRPIQKGFHTLSITGSSTNHPGTRLDRWGVELPLQRA